MKADTRTKERNTKQKCEQCATDASFHATSVQTAHDPAVTAGGLGLTDCTWGGGDSVDTDVRRKASMVKTAR